MCPNRTPPSACSVRQAKPPATKYFCSGGLHSHADREEEVREALLVGRLDGEDVVGRRDRLVELPFLDGLKLHIELRLLEHGAIPGPDGRIALERIRAGLLVHHREGGLDRNRADERLEDLR